MTANTSQSSQGIQSTETTGMPVRLVRGDASPEELAALVAILATTSGDNAPGPTDRQSPATGKLPPSQWSSPRRMVRRTLAHGPGGWRASAFPR